MKVEMELSVTVVMLLNHNLACGSILVLYTMWVWFGKAQTAFSRVRLLVVTAQLAHTSILLSLERFLRLS